MIAKGNTHADGGKLAEYMVTGKAGEKAELHQLRGFASGDIREAFRDVHLMAEATKCTNPLFHVQVRNPEGEELTRAEWEQVADRIGSKLGYSDQPRAMAFHIDKKSGHEHMHLAWSRVEEETMTAKPLPYFKLRLKEVCRELEDTLDLTRVSSDRPRPEIMSGSRAEQEQSRRLDTDQHDIRGGIRDAYDQSDSGKAFAAALADKGMSLCQGERRDFIVVDAEGGIHALGKRLLGTTAAETRHRLADIDRETLPTVAEARQQLPPPLTPEPEKQPVTPSAAVVGREAEKLVAAAAIGASWHEAARDPVAFVARLDDKGLTLAENDQGKFVAVDGRGATHYLSSTALGESGQAVQLSIRAAFGAEQECSLPSVAEVRDRQRVDTPGDEPSVPHGKDSGVNIAAVAAKGMENVADAVGTLASGLENFLFGSSKGAANNQRPLPTAPDATPANAEVKQAVQKMRMTTPEEAVQSADFKARAQTFTLGVRPEIVEAMRRKMEQERERDRDDDERDRDR